MKISEKTIAILKNFACLQEKCLIRPGNVISLRAKAAVYVEAIVAEQFPVEIGIYDLIKFLGVIGLFHDPEFYFGQTAVKIVESDGGSEVRYGYAPASLVETNPPKQKLPTPVDLIQFHLSEQKWLTIQKATSVLSKPEIAVVSDGQTVLIQTENHKDPHGHIYSISLDAVTHGFQCRTILGMEHLKLLRGSYDVTVTPSYTIFNNVSGYDLVYYVGCEPSSTFGKG